MTWRGSSRRSQSKSLDQLGAEDATLYLLRPSMGDDRVYKIKTINNSNHLQQYSLIQKLSSKR